jgi:hypothetical protein
MDERSTRRNHELGAMMAHRGPSASQPGCARIPMMATISHEWTIRVRAWVGLVKTCHCILTRRPNHLKRVIVFSQGAPITCPEPSRKPVNGPLTLTGANRG